MNIVVFFLNIDFEGSELNTFIIPPATNWYGSTPHHIFRQSDTLSILQGTTAKFEPFVETQIFLAEINHLNENSNWIQHYGNDTLFESTGKAIQTTDGGFAITGWVFNENYETRIHLMKMDSLGNLEFYNHYTADSTVQHWGMSLVQTEDEGFLILGFRRYWDEFEGQNILLDDKFLLKTNALGEQEWMKFYPVEVDSLIKSNFHNWIIKLEDGNYLSGGRQVHFREDFVSQETFREFSITKYNQSGEIIWDKVYEENYAVRWENAIISSSGNFIFVGYDIDYPFINGRRQYGVIASTDAEGELLWFRKYYSAPEDVDMDFLKALIEAPDGGYVACGDSFGPWEDSTYQNVWVIKTNSIGCLEPYCDSIFTAVSEPLPATTDKSLNLYPNPTSDHLTVDIGENSTLLGIQIFDSSGKRVEDIQFFRSQHLHSHTLSIRQLPAGLYFVHVRTDKGWRSGKVAKL